MKITSFIPEKGKYAHPHKAISEDNNTMAQPQ